MTSFTFPTHIDPYGDIYHLNDTECLIWHNVKQQWIVYATLEEASHLNLKPYTTN